MVRVHAPKHNIKHKRVSIMSEDKFESLFNDFLLSMVNEKNATLIQELRHKWKQYLNTPVIEKVKQPIPLFTTSDLVPIYNEDENVYVVDRFWEVGKYMAVIAAGAKKERPPIEIFSTKEKAEEYISHYKKRFSANDIEEWIIKEFPFWGSALKDFREFVKGS